MSYFFSNSLKQQLLIVLAVFNFLVLPCSSYAGELPTPNTFGGDFTFESTLNEKTSISDWKGQVVLLNFGFTSCPDVCPLILSKLSLVKSLVEDKDNNGKLSSLMEALGLKEDSPKKDSLQVVFVTVDPERDTIEKMLNYLNNFDPSFVGMRSENEYSEVLRRYGASSQQEEIMGRVEVSHTDYVYLINQEGYVAGFYDIRADYQIFVDAVNSLL